MPRLSVIVPAYNEEATILETLTRVQSQSIDSIDIETIVIDDGSTDNTSTVLAAFADDPRVRVITQQNKGLTITNNIALRAARDEEAYWFDAAHREDPDEPRARDGAAGASSQCAFNFM